MIPKIFRIIHKHSETSDTFTITLEGNDSSLIPKFVPGQFNMLYTFGVGEVPISFSGDSKGTKTIVHTIRKIGAVTAAIGDLEVGDCLGVRGPFGSHWPIENAVGKDVIIMAGGIGLAPLRPVMYSLLSDREKFGNIVLLYGTRGPEEILYKQELMQWRSRFDLELEISVDHASTNWHGHVGVITSLTPTTKIRETDSIAMLCGPEIMMRFCVEKLQNWGVPTSNMYVSMERNMKCAIGHCGHCQFGPHFICKEGPIFKYSDVEWLFNIREI